MNVMSARASYSSSGFVDEVTPKTHHDLTVQEAMSRLNDVPGLSAVRKRDLVSALSKVAKVAGLPPRSVMLTPTTLRPLLKQSAVAWNVKPTTKSTLVCSITQACKLLGVIASSNGKLSTAWSNLQSNLDQRTNMTLIKFMRFCSSLGISPEDVHSDTLHHFETYLETKTLSKKPRAVATAARRSWNACIGCVSGWPKHQLELKSLRTVILLPMSAFPDSFREDVKAFEKRQRGENLDELFGINEDSLNEFQGREGMRPLAALTVTTKLQTIKIAANALTRSGVSLDAVRNLSDLVVPLAHAQSILKTLWTENLGKTRPQIMHVGEILRQLAKFHAHCTAKDVATIAGWTTATRVSYTSIRPKNQRLVETLSSDNRLVMLYSLPSVLMREAQSEPNSFDGFVAARRAIMLEVLIKFAPRLGNLLTLRLDQHLVRSSPKSGRVTAIIIPASETKNQRELFFPVSEATAKLLEDWIMTFRPRSVETSNHFLLPGKGLGPMTRQGVRDSICTVTDERIGIRLNPHLFRHIAAKTITTETNAGLEGVRQFLGHSSIVTASRAYVPFQQDAAYRQFDALIEQRRTRLRSTKPSEKPKQKKTNSGKKVA